jgi:pyruvate dehydrogenase E2 component (dihydrolipoamide acetyltransferase)
MADVIMPQMGESIAEGTVTKWLKNVGDRVERDEPLFEISTDKVDAEIPSPAAGVLREIRVAPGTTVPINTVVAVIGAESDAAAQAPPAVEPAQPQVQPQPAPSEPAPPAPVPAATAPPAPEPRTTDDLPEAAQTAAWPAPPPVAYEIEGEAPSAATLDLAPDETQEISPVPRHGLAAPQPPLPMPGADGGAARSSTTAPDAFAAPERPRAETSAEELRLTRSSPVVRRIAAEHHVDIRDVSGTGIGGRVTKQDILGHIGHPESDAKPAPPPTPPPPPVDEAAAPAPAPAAAPAPPAGTAARSRTEVVPMSPIRRKTAEHMVTSRRTSAHVSTVFEIDMSRVEQLRQKHRTAFEERGVKLTYMAFILKAVVDALKAFPVLNASVDGDSIVYHKDVNLGVAVALDWGLIVPVVHAADEKNVLGLARTVADLAQRARSKKLKVDEVQGGTFTITNPGSFGGLFGTPIINQPQVAILCVGTIEKRPVVRDDAIAIRTMAYFALTFDHRIVDGADADRFMALVKRTLQEFDEAAL